MLLFLKLKYVDFNEFENFGYVNLFSTITEVIATCTCTCIIRFFLCPYFYYKLP